LTGRRAVIAVAAAALLVALSWRFDALGLRSATPFATVASAFDDPPPYPGYRWSRDGRPVDESELDTIAGPAHCDWGTATFLFIGWPPGTVTTGASQARQYVRDPLGAIQGHAFKERLRRNVTLPADARPTGYRYGRLEIWLSPSDDAEGIYVVSGRDAERWPRSDPMTLCA
jgi:hypothetical protein